MRRKAPLDLFGSIGGVGTILNVLREVDVRPIRAAAESPFTLAFTSRDEAFADYLCALMYRGERNKDGQSIRAAVTLPIKETKALTLTDVVVIIAREHADNEKEYALVRELENAKVPVVVALLDDTSAQTPPMLRQRWLPASIVSLPLRENSIDESDAIKRLVKAVRGTKAIDDLALARHLPAFRENVVRALIDDVAFANAAYSVGTGVLEINPVTGLPLNVADMIVLTKNQAIMAYKIALAMGLSSDFKTIMPQLAAVVGGGFIFRQAARGLVGLIPGLGIIPKIGVAFAGTYATGEAIYRWSATGERLSGTMLKSVYDAALERGKQIANSLLKRKREDNRRGPSKHKGLLPPG